jgi:hypothetical protein
MQWMLPLVLGPAVTAAIINLLFTRAIERERMRFNSDASEHQIVLKSRLDALNGSQLEKIRLEMNSVLEEHKKQIQLETFAHNLKYEQSFTNTVAGLKELRGILTTIQDKLTAELNSLFKAPFDYEFFTAVKNETGQAISAFYDYLHGNIAIDPDVRDKLRQILARVFHLELKVTMLIRYTDKDGNYHNPKVEYNEDEVLEMRHGVSAIIFSFTDICDEYTGTGSNANKSDSQTQE